MEAEKLRNQLQELTELLKEATLPEQLSAIVGFDGFVDEIIDVVNKRTSFDSYQRIETIGELGSRIQKAAGLSTNIELVPKTVKLGGNGPIMANALRAVGTKVSYIGALGSPDIHPVFKGLADGCEFVASIADPGHTDALEFADGKVMLGKTQSLKDVNWENLQKALGEKLVDTLTKADLVATVNWTMTPYMTDVWEELLQVLPTMKEDKKPILFVDLADPEKRNNEDILQALKVIEKFNPYFRVALGLNRKEASEVATVLGLSLSGPAEAVGLQEITEAIAAELDIWCFMVHPTMEAGAVCNGKYAYTPGPFTSNPKLTTGAGDNFNAGFCLGLLLGLPIDKALTLGKATSGYYVRNMNSPTFDQSQEFVKLWADNAGQEF